MPAGTHKGRLTRGELWGDWIFGSQTAFDQSRGKSRSPAVIVGSLNERIKLQSAKYTLNVLRVSLAGSRKPEACSPSKGPVQLNCVRWIKHPFGRKHCQQKIYVAPALGSGGDGREAILIFVSRATPPRHVEFQTVRVRHQATP